jgi:hypothetical protein
MRIPKVLTFMALIAPAALAQTTQGLISGRVLDSLSGRPIAAAEVRCENYTEGIATVARSGVEGYFVLPLLSPSLYRIRVEAEGYQAQEIHQVELRVAGRLDFQFRLRQLSDVWEIGQYRSVFLPNSEAILTFYGPDVDTSRAASFEAARGSRGALESSISQVVDPVEVRDLPLAGRDTYTTLVLQPGVAAGTADARGLGLAVSGQRPTSSSFLLDGVENNNYLVSGPLSSVAPEGVQEYRISTNNFSAEYGRTAGVLANAVTKAGGDQWHGLGYFYAENSVLNGNDFQRNLAGLRVAPLHEAEPGFQAGGPILKTRLFSSTSFEYLRTRGYGDPVTVELPTTGFLAYLSSVTPYNPGSAYAQQLLQQHPFPIPTNSALSAPAVVSLPNFADRWLVLERLDYAFPGGKHKLMGRVAESRLDRPDFIWSPYQGFDAPLDQNTCGVMAALTSALAPALTNELRLSWSSDDLRWDRPHPEIPTLASSDQTLLPGSLAFYAYRNRSRSGELSEDLVWARGKHVLQFGGGLLLRGIDGYLTAGRDGRYTFDTVLEFATSSPSSFSTVLNNASLPSYQLPQYPRTYRYNQFQFFAQDTVRATSRLTINFGVRYENFGAPTNTGTQKDALFVPGAGATLAQRIQSGALHTPASGDEQIYHSDNRGWAARIGGSYDLTGRGKSVIRGAYGIFYDRPFDNLWSNMRLNGSSLQTFDINTSYVNILSPYLPQLGTFSLQPINQDFPYITWIDPSLRNAYVQSFFFGMRHEVTNNLSLEVNGTGSLGRKLITTDILNRQFEYTSQLAQILYRANQGDSNYDSLTALARYRSGGVIFQAAYTWSHSIDNQSSPIAGDFFDVAFVRLTSNTGYEAAAAFTQEQNSRLDRGNSDFDQRQNLVLAAILEAPRTLRDSTLSWLTRDWRFSTLASFRSGFPYTVYGSSPLSIVNGRANLINPSATKESIPAPGGQMLLNPAAFSDPTSGIGNLGRNAFVGPGLFNIDVSLNRAFRVKWLGEAGRFNIRADVYNFLNHANLGNPDPQLSSSTFGLATYGRKAQPTGFPGLLPLNETARQVQLMFRVEW